jgi:hypothetical protein
MKPQGIVHNGDPYLRCTEMATLNLDLRQGYSRGFPVVEVVTLVILY